MARKWWKSCLPLFFLNQVNEALSFLLQQWHYTLLHFWHPGNKVIWSLPAFLHFPTVIMRFLEWGGVLSTLIIISCLGFVSEHWIQNPIVGWVFCDELLLQNSETPYHDWMDYCLLGNTSDDSWSVCLMWSQEAEAKLAKAGGAVDVEDITGGSNCLNFVANLYLFLFVAWIVIDQRWR